MKKKILRFLIVYVITFVLVEIDLITKTMFDGENIEIIKNFFYIESAHNYGAGLSILEGKTVLLATLSIIFLMLFVSYDILYYRKTKLYNTAITLIFAGAIGNLIDRLKFAYVRDFLYINLPFMNYCFNLADVFLTVGVVLFCIEILFKREQKKDGKIESRK